MASILQSFIADGFGDDCDELIHECLKETPVTYSAFSKVFRRMQMSCLFHGRQSGAEIAELSEEVINIAKYYMVANTSNFEESVAGLFLVYALVKIQPFENFAYLRLVEEDVPYIERIELVARRDRRVDVLYVLGRLLTENTRFHAAARERGMEPSFRKYLEGSSEDNLGLRPKGVFLRQNEELDVIKELSQLQLQYDAAKIKANVLDLTYVDKSFANELDASLKNIVAGFIHDNNDKETEKREETARSIKDRAMKIKVNPMKHLIGVDDRSPTNTNSPNTSDIQTPPNKLPTSPTKHITSKTTANSTKSKSKGRKRKRKTSESSSSDELDISLNLSDHSCDDIDLDNFSKAEPTSAEASNTVADNEQEIDCNNINLGTLPCIITSEDNGKTYEIEIIDKLKESTKNPEANTNRPNSEKLESEVTKPIKDKRDLKKTILKSRFRRMGLQPVANFKTT